VADSIFGYFLRKESDDTTDLHKRIAYARWFCSSVPEDEFSGSDKVFYHFAYELQRLSLPLVRDSFFDLTRTFLRPYLIKNKLKVAGTESYTYEDPTHLQPIIDATTEILQAEFDVLETGDYPIESFPVEAKMFFNTRREKLLMDMFLRGSQLINTPEKYVGGGTSDTLQFVSNEVAKIKVIYDDEKLQDIGVYVDSNAGNMDFVTDFGLKTIDEDMHGGLHTGQLLLLDGGPGSGKTKFATAHGMYRAAVLHMQNVLYFVLEQSVREIESILISTHLFNLYGIRVDPAWINFNSITDEETQKKVEAARYDLFESGNYGAMHIVSGSLQLNDMTERMDVMDTLFGPFQLIIVDYMYLLTYQYVREVGMLDTTEVIRRGQRNFKAYLLRKNKAGIAVNQLNREGVDASKNDKDIDETMSAGGMEMYRSADYSIVITYTKAMEAQRKRRLQNPKKRSSAGFGNLLVSVALDVNYFYEEGGDL
jgi:RecA/RadA recombinase